MLTKSQRSNCPYQKIKNLANDTAKYRGRSCRHIAQPEYAALPKAVLWGICGRIESKLDAVGRKRADASDLNISATWAGGIGAPWALNGSG
jgi:hypothetical protein